MKGRRKATNQPGMQRLSRPLGVARMAREIRRQERSSDFNGYTVNYSVASLREFFREVGGPKWVLSRVPLSMIKCDQTHMTVKDLLDTADSVSDRRRLSKQARQMVREIRAGVVMPEIFLTRRDRNEGEHWIIEGYRRMLAHRIARTSTILAYHPIDLFSTAGRRRAQGAQVH
jgi:hypothetical protein